MWDSNSKTYDLHVKAYGRQLFDAIRNGVHNNTNGQLKVTSVIVSGNDTEMTYSLQLERKDKRKPTQGQVRAVLNYCLGIADGRQVPHYLTGNGLPSGLSA